GLTLWRTGTEYNRPKWGIYRSLDTKNEIQDEVVRFADFCISEQSYICESPWLRIDSIPRYSLDLSLNKIKPFPGAHPIDSGSILRNSIGASHNHPANNSMRTNPFKPKTKDRHVSSPVKHTLVK